jgi:phosphoribosylglycinamide formyltransferase-1
MSKLKIIPDAKSHDDLKIAVLISGRGSNLKALIEQCSVPDFPAQIVVVITNKKEAGGIKHAEAANIPYVFLDHKTFDERESFDMAMHAELLTRGVNFIFLAGFMRVLSKAFIDKWHDKIVNIHPSLLPDFPGVDTHKRVLESGAKFHGCTVHFVREDVDSGPIICQEVLKVEKNDTPETLAGRLLQLEHKTYKHALKIIAEKKYLVKGNRVEIWD